jgi:hypothetical protein
MRKATIIAVFFCLSWFVSAQEVPILDDYIKNNYMEYSPDDLAINYQVSTNTILDIDYFHKEYCTIIKPIIQNDKIRRGIPLLYSDAIISAVSSIRDSIITKNKSSYYMIMSMIYWAVLSDYYSENEIHEISKDIEKCKNIFPEKKSEFDDLTKYIERSKLQKTNFSELYRISNEFLVEIIKYKDNK